MLLCVDIGNTSISLGAFEDERLTFTGRVIKGDLERVEARLDTVLAPIRACALEAVAVASVNPNTEFAFCDWLKLRRNMTALKVGAELVVKMPILCDRPERVGADRVANALAAYERVKGTVIVVDFGTATTFDVVSARGEYLGGAIAPGMGLSADALKRGTAFLPRVEVSSRPRALGRNTEEAIQSGIFWGHVGMVERLVQRLGEELGGKPEVLATGGYAELVGPETRCVSQILPHLTLEGIRLAYVQNVGQRSRPTA